MTGHDLTPLGISYRSPTGATYDTNQGTYLRQHLRRVELRPVRAGLRLGRRRSVALEQAPGRAGLRLGWYNAAARWRDDDPHQGRG